VLSSHHSRAVAPKQAVAQFNIGRPSLPTATTKENVN
jgi:hypothetical protein